MNELTRKLISGIEKGDQEAILGAGEVGRFLIFGLSTSSIAEPYNTELSNSPATTEDGELLQGALISYIQNNNFKTNSSAIYALGNFQNPNNIDFLKSQLSKYLEELLNKNSLVHSSIIALDHSSEDIIQNGSSSLFDIEDNVETAHKYLAKMGLVFPW